MASAICPSGDVCASCYPRVGFIVTNLARPPENVAAFYNQRGTCEQWIKEGKGATVHLAPAGHAGGMAHRAASAGADGAGRVRGTARTQRKLMVAFAFFSKLASALTGRGFLTWNRIGLADVEAVAQPERSLYQEQSMSKSLAYLASAAIVSIGSSLAFAQDATFELSPEIDFAAVIVGTELAIATSVPAEVTLFPVPAEILGGAPELEDHIVDLNTLVIMTIIE